MIKLFYYITVIVALSAGCSQKKSAPETSQNKIKQNHVTGIVDPEAVAIIKKTENNYSGLQSYFDSGKAIISFYNNKHPFKKALYFKTAYTNEGLFNFEYYEPGKSNSMFVINKNNQTVRSWWGVTNELKSYTSLSLPLAAATGVSSSTSYMIPRLLKVSDKSEKSNILNRLTSPVLSGEEIIDGHPCHKISEADSAINKFSVWIDKKDFFIRRIQTDRAVPSLRDKGYTFRVNSIYHYYIYTPKDINDKIFEFKPYREIEL